MDKEEAPCERDDKEKMSVDGGRTVSQHKESRSGVPIHLKLTLTIREAAEYSNIGINKIDSLLRQPNCPFVLYVGTRKLVKRREFEDFIRHQLII